MCKSKKATRAANRERARRLAANRVPGDGSGGGSPQPMSSFILGEHVPEFTFISNVAMVAETGASSDSFLASSFQFHTFHGLKPGRFDSVEDLIDKLDALSATKINRLRVATHAGSSSLLVPMCKIDPRGFMTAPEKNKFQNGYAAMSKGELKSCLEGDAEWIKSGLGISHLLQNLDPNTLAKGILEHIKTEGSLAAVLTKFNFNATFGNISKAVEDVILGSLGDMLVDGNNVKMPDFNGNNLSLTPSQKTLLKQILAKIHELNKANALKALGSSFSLTDLNNLETAVRHFTLSDYIISFPSGMALPKENFIMGSDILIALNNGFRQKLARVRLKFKAASWIDVRGCLLGSDVDFMKDLSKLFGDEGNRPRISAPRLFQNFPQISFEFGDRTVIEGLFAQGTSRTFGSGANAVIKTVSGTDFVRGLDRWLSVIGHDQTYFNFWKTLFSGSALNFCSLTWKPNLPALKIKGGHQENWNALAFADLIVQLKKICNLGSTQEPKTSTVNALKSFVETKIPQYLPTLTKTISGADVPQILPQLQTISQELNTNIPVPASNLAEVQDYQKKISDFISDTKLVKIKDLLLLAKNIVEAINPSIQLLLHFGVPVVSIFPDGLPDLADLPESPDIRTCSLVALTHNKDSALRLLLKSLWIEELPNPNSVTSAVLDTSHPSHRQVAALSPNAIITEVFFCPLPEYMFNIISTP